MTDRPGGRPGAAARRVAARLLEGVVDDRTGLDVLTDPASGRAVAGWATLDPRDRALARAIATVALRRRGAIERALARFLDRPLPRGARHLKHLLHVAAAQVLHMDVADRAAIDLAVSEASDPRSRRFKPLVNAVLRRVAEHKNELSLLPPEPGDVPAWLWKAWRRDHGRERAMRLVASLRDEPALDLSVAHQDAELPEGLWLANGTFRVADGETRPVPELPGYASGGWWVQDAAASLPARLLGDVRGLRVLDACAAPGGKTAQLCAGGARVTALDRSQTRLERLRSNLDRLGMEAETVAGDAGTWEAPAPFDAVLLDAPCSALGTLRRHPDVAWTRTETDVEALAALQARLLERTLALVRPGGTVVFATCSVMKAEGEALWAAFSRRDDVEALPVTDLWGIDAVSAAGTVRTMPWHEVPFMRGHEAPFSRGHEASFMGAHEAPLATAHEAPSAEGHQAPPPDAASASPNGAKGMDGFFVARFRRR